MADTLNSFGPSVNPVDFNRLGGLDWATRTSGHLTAAERRQLFGRMVSSAVDVAIDVFKTIFGSRPQCEARLDTPVLEPPDTALTRATERVCAGLPPFIVAHSCRTWMLGLALAVVECNQLDAESFYCAALLHDYGLVSPTHGRDFTLAGAAHAIQCAAEAGVDSQTANFIADAICVHPTAGLSAARDGLLGYYLQRGAVADISGLHLWKLGQTYVSEVFSRHPRDEEFGRDMAATIHAEATAIPNGRFAFYTRFGMTFAIRLAGRRP